MGNRIKQIEALAIKLVLIKLLAKAFALFNFPHAKA